MVTTLHNGISMIVMGDWTPRPGELLEFVPTEQNRDAARRAPATSAPASFVQKFHIANKIKAERAGGTPATSLGGTFTVTGRLDRAALQRAVAEFVLRHETLRCWFAAEETSEGFSLIRHLVPPGDIEFTTTSAGVFDSGEQIRDAVGRRFRSGTDPLHWPPFVFGAIDHGDDEFTVYFSTDHSHTDGYSTLLTFSELHTLYEAAGSGVDADLPATGSHLEYCSAESVMLERLDLGTPEIQEISAVLLDSDGHFSHLPVDYGLAAGETAPRVDTRVQIFDAADADAFSAVCKANGASFSAGLFAALGLTDLEMAGHTRYLSFNTVSTRMDPKYQAAQGWFINYLPVYFTVGESALFTYAVQQAKAAFDRVKPLTTVPILGLLATAAQTTGVAVPSLAAPPMVAYMDFRRFDAATMPHVHSIHSLTPNSMLGPYSQIWFCRESDNTVILIKHPDTAAARVSIGGYADRLRTIVGSVAHTGNYLAAAPAAVNF